MGVTVVIIIVVVLALIVMGLILSPVIRAIRTAPDKVQPSEPYRRPPPPGEGGQEDTQPKGH